MGLEEFERYEEKLKKRLEQMQAFFKLHIFDYDVNTKDRKSDLEKEMQVVKSICFIIRQEKDQIPILVILRVEDKVSTKKLKKIFRARDVRLANAKEVLTYTGYEIGGVPPLGHDVKEVIIDSKAIDQEKLLGGGGSPRALLEFNTLDLIKYNNAKVKEVRKKEN